MIKKSLLRPFLLTICTLYGLFLRYKSLNGRSWWVDEINQFNHTIGPFKPIWQRLPNGELTCFPGDYLLTYPFVQLFGENKWGVAIPHILITITGFYCLYLICQRYIKSTLGAVIVFLLFSFNAELIFHAFELRPYAVLATLGLAIFYCTETIVSPIYTLSRIKKFFIGALFAVSILYHAYGILIVGFCFLYSFISQLLQHPFKTLLKRVFLFYLIIALVSLPLWIWYATYNFQPDITTSPTFQFIPNPMLNPIGFLKSILGNLIGYRYFYPLLIAPLISLCLPNSLLRHQWIFLITLIILPIGLILNSDLSMHYWFLQRQFIWSIALFSFFIGWSMDIILKRIFK